MYHSRASVNPVKCQNSNMRYQDSLSLKLPLTREDEIKTAYAKLQSQMNKRAQMVDTVLGWKGESHLFRVSWHEDLGIWNYYDPQFAKTHYWCTYGVENPNEISMLHIQQ